MDINNQKNGGQGRFKGGAYGKMDGSRSFGGENDSPEKVWNNANYQKTQNKALFICKYAKDSAI